MCATKVFTTGVQSVDTRCAMMIEGGTAEIAMLGAVASASPVKGILGASIKEVKFGNLTLRRFVRKRREGESPIVGQDLFL